MLWIFALAIVMPIDIGLCASDDPTVSTTAAPPVTNLTAITWEHAVNRMAKLEAALEGELVRLS